MDFQPWDSGFEQASAAPVTSRRKDNRILIAVLLLVALAAVIIVSSSHPEPIVSAWDGCSYVEENTSSFSLLVEDSDIPLQCGVLLLSSEGKLLQWMPPDSVSIESEGSIMHFSALHPGSDDLVVPVAYQREKNQLLIGEPMKLGTDPQLVPTQSAAPSNGPIIQLGVSALDGSGFSGVQLEMHLEDLEPGYTYNAGFMLARQGESPQPAGERYYAWGVSEADFIANVTLPAQDVAKEHMVMAYVYVHSAEEMIFSEPLLFVPDQLNLVTPVVTPESTPTPLNVPTPTPKPMTGFTVTTDPGRNTPTPNASPTPARRSLVPTADLFSIYDKSTRYYYLQLNQREKSCFADLYDAICAREATATFTEPCTEDELLRALDALSFDCPELLDCWNANVYQSRLDRVVSCDLAYTISAADHESNLERILDIVSRIEAGCQGDYEKEIALCAYIQKNTVYDKTTMNCASAIGTFIEGRAKCSGYAQGAMLALRRMGIPCASVTGFTYEDDGSLSDAGHQWIVVQIEGQWYQCDPTWDDAGDDEAFANACLLKLPYTNITDAMLADERLTNNFAWRSSGFTQPICTSTAANYYNREGCFVPRGGDAVATFKRALISASDSGREGFVLFFESHLEYETFLTAEEFKNVTVNDSDGDRVFARRCRYYDVGLFYVEEISEY